MFVAGRCSLRIKDLTPGQTPRYSPTGHLLFMDANEGTLLAAPFDAKNLELTGAALPVVEGVLQDRFGSPFFDISASGRLVYRTASAEGQAAGAELILVGNWAEELKERVGN